MSYQIDATGIVFAVFSFLSFLVLIPPLFYHCINKNIPAISLIVWFSYKNLVGFINAIIWSGPNFPLVTKGKGYCDVTVRITSASNLGQLCATTCLIFNLYMVISSQSYKFLSTDSKTKRTVNVLMCWLNPVFVMGLSILAQAHRYAIVRYRGCAALYNYGFFSIVLSSLWNVLWMLAAFVFASLTIVAYIRKRRDLQDLLKCSNSGLNARKFGRLIVFSLLIMVVLSPVVIVGFYSDLASALFLSHKENVWISDPAWNTILYIDEGSMPVIQRIIEIILSFCTFFLFGLGTEALKMYRRIFVSIGILKLKKFNASSETEFQGFRKQSSFSVQESPHAEKWFPCSACGQAVPGAKPPTTSLNLSPTIHFVSGTERGSNFGIKGYNEWNSEQENKRYLRSSEFHFR